MYKAVIFDADGTLLDSLPPHVDFCHAMNAKLGLGLDSLPDRNSGRGIAAAPMDAFLRKAGFPEDSIEECVAQYESSFRVEHPVKTFEGTEDLIASLREGNLKLAIVTSNTSANVRASLGDIEYSFEFIIGIDNGPISKTDSIARALERLGIDASEAVYVGDTLKDHDCAQANGVSFIGANYGFEDLVSKGLNSPVVDSISDILPHALRH